MVVLSVPVVVVLSSVGLSVSVVVLLFVVLLMVLVMMMGLMWLFSMTGTCVAAVCDVGWLWYLLPHPRGVWPLPIGRCPVSAPRRGFWSVRPAVRVALVPLGNGSVMVMGATMGERGGGTHSRMPARVILRWQPIVSSCLGGDSKPCRSCGQRF